LFVETLLAQNELSHSSGGSGEQTSGGGDLMESLQVKDRHPGFDKKNYVHSDLRQINPQKAITIIKHRMAVQKALEMIKARIQDPPTLGELASFSGLSRTYFSHVFKEVMEMRLQDYLIQTRLGTAKDLLSNIDLRIKKVAYEAGFCDPNYFSRFFRKKMGLNPTNWRLRKFHIITVENKIGKSGIGESPIKYR
jgi:AraC-like DNA-binding protein